MRLNQSNFHRFRKSISEISIKFHSFSEISVDFRKKIKKIPCIFSRLREISINFGKKRNFFNTLELSVNFRKTLELFRKTTEYFRKHCYSKRYSNRYRKFEKFPKISGRKISGNERKFPEIFVPEQFGIVHSETFGNLRKC
jgi:hypothetical protein